MASLQQTASLVGRQACGSLATFQGAGGMLFRYIGAATFQLDKNFRQLSNKPDVNVARAEEISVCDLVSGTSYEENFSDGTKAAEWRAQEQKRAAADVRLKASQKPEKLAKH